ncbi:MAG: alpha/beta fold hydrolase [Candidatus Dormibacteria bacterium]
MAKLTTNGVELYYERKGSGEPLLLVPGLLFSAESWRDQVDALSDQYDCVAVDLRGQHRSETTTGGAGYDLWNQAEDIHGLIAALGIAPVHYAGLSMGGMIGMRLAIRHPEDLRDLILLDTTSMAEDPEAVERYRAFRQVVADGELEAVLPALPPIFFSDDYPTQQPARVKAWFESLRAGDPQGFVRASGAVDERVDITAELAAIALPALVIQGTEDAAIPVEKAQATAAAIPGCRFELVEGAGHQSNMDHPEAVTRLMRDFLASVRGTAPAGMAG